MEFIICYNVFFVYNHLEIRIIAFSLLSMSSLYPQREESAAGQTKQRLHRLLSISRLLSVLFPLHLAAICKLTTRWHKILPTYSVILAVNLADSFHTFTVDDSLFCPFQSAADLRFTWGPIVPFCDHETSFWIITYIMWPLWLAAIEESHTVSFISDPLLSQNFFKMTQLNF